MESGNWGKPTAKQKRISNPKTPLKSDANGIWEVGEFAHNMLSSTCSHSLIRRPFLQSPAPKTRVSTRPGALYPISRSFRIFESHSRPSSTRWTRISCFRQENSSSETPKADYIGHLVPEEVVKSEFDDSKVVKKDWGFTLREAADAVFRAIGSRWSVPWTAETIMQLTWQVSAGNH
ncbi:CAAX amino terminal protease family protein [Prunus dulcis]|uniref:CAAX amino terminal protease family protein n=1 Tax=Prunus dulcis TaxID=3755 RepID=A0A4Y1RGT3_PRUDU|nr:CAAX amino terminal protease family protein [Prunus dulcis]